MLRIPIARLPLGLVPRWRQWRSCLQIAPRPFVEPPTCFRVKRAVIFFVALKLSSFSMSYVLTVRNGSVFFLGPCQVLVVQSFALSYRLSEIGSLIEWLPRSFCIYRENPMLRILNSLRSCRDVDVFSTAILSYNIMLFSPPDGW